MTWFLRPLVVAAIAAAALSACGVWQPWIDTDDCEMKPVGDEAAGFRIGPAVAVATSCVSSVEVDGRTYTMGAGTWLDQESLLLTEYALVTRANGPVADPQTYSLEGIDPLELLVMKGPYTVLWGRSLSVPEGMCVYADPLDAGYPGDVCPLQQGRTYGPVELIIACGFDRPMGPYGGFYWRVVDPPAEPPAGSPYPGMYRYLDYGTIELMDDGSLTYVSEVGATLTLERDSNPEASDRVCPRPDNY